MERFWPSTTRQAWTTWGRLAHPALRGPLGPVRGLRFGPGPPLQAGDSDGRSSQVPIPQVAAATPTETRKGASATTTKPATP